MSDNPLYRPPAPIPSSPLRSLLRVIRQGDGDLLSLVPADAYSKPLTWLGYSRRSILLINDTDLCREVLQDKQGIFPKNDLMVGALEGLVGNSLFVSSGSTWQRQRQMIDPAFSQLRINAAFTSMSQAVDDYQLHLDALVQQQAVFSLDKAMSHLTADIICRTIFSQPLSSSIAAEVFNDFLLFERSVASVNLKQLIFGKPWAKITQPPAVVAACQRIRKHIGTMLDPRLGAASHESRDDIVAAVIAARDTETGKAFTRDELIDQIGVFFLAGHETTASVLTWVFFILSQQPAVATRIADDIQRLTRGGELKMEHLRKLGYVRNVFREALRLYPPITFLPRVALRPAAIGDKRVKRGAMIMISPWTAHRNALLWQNADRFDPDRFDNESLNTAHQPAAVPHASSDTTRKNQDTSPEHDSSKGTHLSFGIGPRVCVGASFATLEATLIISRLAQRYQFNCMNTNHIRPVARLTTRPAEEVQIQVRFRHER